MANIYDTILSDTEVEQINTILKSMNISQENFGRLLGVPNHYVHRFLKTKKISPILYPTLAALLEFLVPRSLEIKQLEHESFAQFKVRREAELENLRKEFFAQYSGAKEFTDDELIQDDDE